MSVRFLFCAIALYSWLSQEAIILFYITLMRISSVDGMRNIYTTIDASYIEQQIEWGTINPPYGKYSEGRHWPNMF